MYGYVDTASSVNCHDDDGGNYARREFSKWSDTECRYSLIPGDSLEQPRATEHGGAGGQRRGLKKKQNLGRREGATMIIFQIKSVG